VTLPHAGKLSGSFLAEWHELLAGDTGAAPSSAAWQNGDHNASTAGWLRLIAQPQSVTIHQSGSQRDTSHDASAQHITDLNRYLTYEDSFRDKVSLLCAALACCIAHASAHPRCNPSPAYVAARLPQCDRTRRVARAGRDCVTELAIVAKCGSQCRSQVLSCALYATVCCRADCNAGHGTATACRPCYAI
jgi:hypothetical protein